MVWAMKQRLATDPAARHVLLCLANYAGENGTGAFPATQRLADDTGLSRRSVIRKLDELEACGAIRPGNQAIAAAYIERDDRRPKVFDLAIERGDSTTLRSERGDSGDANGVTTVQERGVTVSPNTSSIRQENPLKGPRPFAGPLPDWIKAEVWEGFLAMRRRIRKPLTARAIELTIKRLEGFRARGIDPNDALDQSTQNSWTGIYEPKGEHHAECSNGRSESLVDKAARINASHDHRELR